MAHCWIGSKGRNDNIVICEGYATGASIYQATKLPICVAFCARNLVHVARYCRDKYPTSLIIIGGDDDPAGHAGMKNAANAANAAWVLPRHGGDFNDEFLLEDGAASVKSSFDLRKFKKTT